MKNLLKFETANALVVSIVILLMSFIDRHLMFLQDPGSKHLETSILLSAFFIMGISYFFLYFITKSSISIFLSNTLVLITFWLVLTGTLWNSKEKLYIFFEKTSNLLLPIMLLFLMIVVFLTSAILISKTRTIRINAKASVLSLLAANGLSCAIVSFLTEPAFFITLTAYAYFLLIVCAYIAHKKDYLSLKRVLFVLATGFGQIILFLIIPVLV